MELHNLENTTRRPKKRLGRGLGSGKGKTGGRGTKGQKARGKIPVGFIGGTLPLYKKLPYKRGKNNLASKSNFKPINLTTLSGLKTKTVIDLEKLLEEKLITKNDLKRGVKVLGEGEINIALTVKLPVSESARQKIEAAGGSVE